MVRSIGQVNVIAMPRTPLPPYDPLQPILRGHIAAVATIAYKDYKECWREIWAKVLHQNGTHPLGKVDLESLDSLNLETLEYIGNALAHIHRMNKISTPNKKKNGKSKRRQQAR